MDNSIHYISGQTVSQLFETIENPLDTVVDANTEFKDVRCINIKKTPQNAFRLPLNNNGDDTKIKNEAASKIVVENLQEIPDVHRPAFVTPIEKKASGKNMLNSSKPFDTDESASYFLNNGTSVGSEEYNENRNKNAIFKNSFHSSLDDSISVTSETLEWAYRAARDKLETASNISICSNVSDRPGSNLSSISDISGYEEELFRIKKLLVMDKSPEVHNSYLKSTSNTNESAIMKDYEFKIQNLNMSLQECLNENEKLKVDIRQAEEKAELVWSNKYQEVLRQNAHSEGKLESLQKQVEILTKQKENMSEKLKKFELNLENNRIKETFDLREKLRNSEQKNISLVANLEMLKNENDSLKKETSSLETESQKVKIQLQETKIELDSKLSAIQGLKDKITEQFSQIQVTVQEKQRTDNSINNLKNELHSLKKSEMWYTDQLHLCQEDKAKLHKNLMSFQTSMVSKTHEVEKLKIENLHLRQNVEEIQERAMKEKETLMKRLEVIQADMLEREATLTGRLELQKYTENESNVVKENDLNCNELLILELKEKISSLEGIIDNRNEVLKQAEEENKNLLVRFTTLQKTLCEKEIVIQSLENNEKVLKSKSELLQELIKDNENAVLGLRNEKIGLEVALHAANKEKIEVDEAVNKLRSDFSKLLMNYERMQKELQERDNAISVLEKEKQELFMKNNWKVCEMEELKHKIVILENLQADFKDLKNIHDVIVVEKNNVGNENYALNKRLCVLEKLNEDYEDQINSLKGINKHLTRENSSGIFEVTIANKKLNEMEKLHSDLQKEYNTNYEQNETLIQENSVNKTEFEIIQMKLFQLEKCYFELQKSYNCLEEENNKLSHENFVRKSEFEKLLFSEMNGRTSHNENRDSLAKENEAVITVTNNLTELAKLNAELREKCFSTEKINYRLTDENNTFKFATENLKGELEKLRNEFDSIKKSNEQLLKENALYKMQADEYSKTLLELEKTNDELEKKYHSIKEIHDNIVCENSKYKKLDEEVSGLKKINSELQVKYGSQNASLSKQCVERHNEITNLKNIVSSREKQLMEYSKNIEIMQEEILNRESVIDDLKKNNNSVNKHMSEIESENSKVILENENLKRELCNHVQVIEQYHELCKNLEKKNSQNKPNANVDNDTLNSMIISVANSSTDAIERSFKKILNDIKILKSSLDTVDEKILFLFDGTNNKSNIDISENFYDIQNLDSNLAVSLIMEKINKIIKNLDEYGKQRNVLTEKLHRNEKLRLELEQDFLNVKKENAKLYEAMDSVSLKKNKASICIQANLGTEAEKIGSMLNDIKNLKTTIRVNDMTYKEKYKRYEVNIRTLLKTVKEHMRGRKIAEKELNSVKNSNVSLQLNLNRTQTEFENLQTACEEYKKQVGQLQGNILTLEKEAGRLDVGLNDDNKVIVENLQRNCEIFEVQLKQTDENVLLLEQKLKLENDSKVDLQKQLFNEKQETLALRKQLQKIQTEFETTNCLFESSKSEYLALEKSYELLKESERNLFDQLSIEQEQNQNFKSQICALNKQIDEYQNKQLMTSDEMELLNASLQQKSQELTNVQEEFDSNRKCWLENENIMRQALNKLKNELTELRLELETVRNDKFSIQKQCAELRTALQGVLNQNKALKANIDNQYLTNYKPDLTANLPSPSKFDDSHISRLLQRSSINIAPLNNLQKCLDSLKEEMTTLQKQITAKTQIIEE